MKLRFLLSAFLIFVVPLFARAEYRVFLLKISRDPAGQDFRLVESTLDPEQYPLYYPLAAGETVSYTETWRCYGRTSEYKQFCPNPKGQIPAALPEAP